MQDRFNNAVGNALLPGCSSIEDCALRCYYALGSQLRWEPPPPPTCSPDNPPPWKPPNMCTEDP